MNTENKILSEFRESGLTQEEFAEKLGQHRSAVYRWLAGGKVQLNKRAAVCAALGKPVDWLDDASARDTAADAEKQRFATLIQSLVDASPILEKHNVSLFDYLSASLECADELLNAASLVRSDLLKDDEIAMQYAQDALRIIGNALEGSYLKSNDAPDIGKMIGRKAKPIAGASLKKAK